ncbi:zf-HC2 domain-containing protein [Vreelandella lionensis]|uniref:zf-HC2 domain-containing protein n=1 Tax=Vreelandella lionensis TaxID=1144478 RepID=UPI001FB3AE56|nr:zf-HC2 domain-containing protein [Halomonas lionensis]
MSLKLDRALTFKERTALRFHLSICSACRACARQFTLRIMWVTTILPLPLTVKTSSMIHNAFWHTAMPGEACISGLCNQGSYLQKLFLQAYKI